MVRVAQPCEWTQCHWNVQLNSVKIVCFIICDFYHMKKSITEGFYVSLTQTHFPPCWHLSLPGTSVKAKMPTPGHSCGLDSTLCSNVIVFTNVPLLPQHPIQVPQQMQTLDPSLSSHICGHLNLSSFSRTFADGIEECWSGIPQFGFGRWLFHDETGCGENVAEMLDPPLCITSGIQDIHLVPWRCHLWHLQCLHKGHCLSLPHPLLTNECLLDSTEKWYDIYLSLSDLFYLVW